MAETPHIPNYQELVPHPADRLPQTRAGISPKSLNLLREHAPEFADVQRFPVPDGKVLWEVSFPEYDPPYVDAPAGLLIGKDVETLHDGIPPGIASWEGPIRYDDEGRPLHPGGRTGLRGRLTMNHLGPTPAADAVVLRGDSPENREVIIVSRTDNGLLALPAGKLDPGETSLDAVTRETKEETGLELDFTKAEVIFAGVVDDDRATDNAWFETAAYRLVLTGAEAQVEPRAVLQDVRRAEWMPVREVLRRPTHASTRLMLQLALKGLK